ncbi:beta-1 4-N-acetylgalactosaminyltransferase bre-4 [Biomphalaria glabrata]|nr:beta-1; 4-N-acetylgalactosaminyltransferase bre-4-like [Biomphalaria glabrata]
MRIKRNRTYTEICVFGGCFLLVFLSVAQIIVFSHRAKNAVGQVRSNVEREVPMPEPIATSRSVPPALQKPTPKARGRARAQMEVRELEKALAKLMRESSMTPDEAYTKYQNDLYVRRVQNIIIGVKDRMPKKSSNVSQPLIASGRENFRETNSTVPYGVPFSFKRSTPDPGDPSVDGGVRAHHFHDFDQAEVKELKSLLSQDNFTVSHEYEDNYYKVKSQFKEGTELFVDEEKLKGESQGRLNVCPKEPASLVGNTTDVNLNISVNIDVINELHSDVRMGGEWRPPSCISRHRVAIIIPYRDRWNHLKVLLHYLIPTLKRQQIHFRIFVVEQYGNETFNKGRIMNAAFREALQLFDFQCVTFHDVDLVPEDDRNMYSCTEQPKHMSISIDKFQYTLPYQGLVGGVLMFRTDHFQLVNGYSNMYWGWGAEDDDMTTRILHRGLRIYRPPSNIARYKMVKHEGRKGSEVAVRMKLLRSAARRSKLEGLNNVQYKLVSTQIRELFTHFIVDIGTP